MTLAIVLTVVALALAGVAIHDVTQRKHSILRNFPIVGHLRFLLESFGPELRQYIVTGNDEERPFTRDQRRWVYASAKGQDNHFGFGTDVDLDTATNHIIVAQSAFPLPTPAHGDSHLPSAKVLGGAHGRTHAFRPNSVVNVSAMSFGALSGAAVEAMNRGVAMAGAMQCTGEGGLSPHHRHGGDLILQVGTGYFGCRTLDGKFDLDRLADLVQSAPVRAIEIKLSQGAKPGLGGILPGAKVTPEIAAIRGVPVGVDCVSPSTHSAFTGVDGLIEFVERVADRTGLPVGIKSAVGETQFWNDLATRMAATGAGPDFIQVDGGEGGTGAAPLAFTDNVSLPYRLAMARVYKQFALADITDDVVFVGSGKLGFPETGALAFALGADLLAVGREAMLSVGCIQAQKCHTGKCPTGVATQSPYLARGLDPTDKAVRMAGYLATLRAELKMLAHACGVTHPALIGANRVEILDGRLGSRTAADVFGYQPGWGLPPAAALADLEAQLAATPV